MRSLPFVSLIVAAACMTVTAQAGPPIAASRHQTAASLEPWCQALTAVAVPHGAITSAAFVPAQGADPEYCRVLATIEPETDLEVRLPTLWAERLLHLGGVAFDGFIPNLSANAAELRAGYALTASNGGHRDPTRGATRFLDNPTLVEDYAHAAIEKTVRAAKAVITAYYGRPATYSYFSGCSNGGREALNAAAHYGDEYDGVIAGAPAVELPGLVSRWTYASRLTAPSPAKLAAVNQAQIAACDTLDGLADGNVSNPDACHFDPASLRCAPNENGPTCLTDQEIESVQTLRADLTLENGRLVYPRYGIGNPGTGLGVFMPVAGPGMPTFSSNLSRGFLPFVVYNDATYNPATYDVQFDLRTVVNVLERTYDFSANANPLARFLRSGKKVIVWQGTEDTLISPVATATAYQRLTRRAGHDADNARLYTLPAVQHCGGGTGVNRFDFIAALAKWVEDGREPRTVIGSRSDAAGNPLFTRPICEFPRYPRYDGRGNPNDAASFTCVGSGRHFKNDD